MAITITQPIKYTGPIDMYYGPWQSIEDACNNVPQGSMPASRFRYKGKTVAINTVDGIVEYWWKDGLTDNDLVVKQTSGGGLPEGLKVAMFNKNNGTGVQNSILSDSEGWIVLPEPTIHYEEHEFNGWSFDGTTSQPGDTLQLENDVTTFVAVWGEEPYQDRIELSIQLEHCGIVENKVFEDNEEVPIEDEKYILTYTSGNLNEVKIEFKADDGYEMKQPTINPALTSTWEDNMLTFRIPANHAKEYSITASAEEPIIPGVDITFNGVSSIENPHYYEGDRIEFQDTTLLNVTKGEQVVVTLYDEEGGGKIAQIEGLDYELDGERTITFTAPQIDSEYTVEWESEPETWDLTFGGTNYTLNEVMYSETQETIEPDEFGVYKVDKGLSSVIFTIEVDTESYEVHSITPEVGGNYPEYTLTVNRDTEVVVDVQEKQQEGHSITLNKLSNGIRNMTLSPSQDKYAPETTVTLAVTLNRGYENSSVEIEGVEVTQSGNNFRFIMPDFDITANVNAALITRTLTLSTTDASVNRESGNVQYGTTVELVYTPAYVSYVMEEPVVTGTVTDKTWNSETNTLTFKMQDTNVTVNARAIAPPEVTEIENCVLIMRGLDGETYPPSQTTFDDVLLHAINRDKITMEDPYTLDVNRGDQEFIDILDKYSKAGDKGGVVILVPQSAGISNISVSLFDTQKVLFSGIVQTKSEDKVTYNDVDYDMYNVYVADDVIPALMKVTTE